jgi:hypothetical protein
MNPVGIGTAMHASFKPHDASTVISARSAEGNIGKATATEKKGVLEHGRRPRYARELMWSNNEDIISPAAQYSLFANPLPRPPLSAFQNSAASDTIQKHPDLFKIICGINVNVFKMLLANHPNPDFVHSVVVGLCEGFWPLADKPDYYPITCDNPFREPKNERE